MENSLEKSRNTSGPFPLPIGHRVGKSKMDFIEYCEFKHSDNMNCALWKDRDGEYLSSVRNHWTEYFWTLFKN